MLVAEKRSSADRTWMERWSSIQDKTAAETMTRMFSTPAFMERGVCRETSAVGILGTDAAGRTVLQEEYILIMLNYCLPCTLFQPFPLLAAVIDSGVVSRRIRALFRNFYAV